MLAAGRESPYAEWIERWEERGERPITTRVPCGDWFETRDRALIAHATQIDPEGSWFSVPMQAQRDLWPTEDYEPGAQRGAGRPARGRPVRRRPHRPADRPAQALVTPLAVLAATTTPSPGTPPADKVTPGFIGFLVVFVLAIVTWLLLRNMTGHLRRMRFREEQEAARVRAEQPDPPAGGTSPGAEDPGAQQREPHQRRRGVGGDQHPELDPPTG
nr:hypothetical protein [Angustibacter aerolatus]